MANQQQTQDRGGARQEQKDQERRNQEGAGLGREKERQEKQGGAYQGMSKEDRERGEKEQRAQAKEMQEAREKDNNPTTKRFREYGEDAPGMHPANLPGDRLYGDDRRKGTRLDLEDVTGNPGHRGVNPDAPATSINRGPNAPPDDVERQRVASSNLPIGSINEPAGIDPGVGSANEPPGSRVYQGIDGDGENTKLSQRMGAQQYGTTPTAGQGSSASINEPAGSTIGSNMPTEGEGEDDVPELLDLDPDVATMGDETDITMNCYGEGFTADSVITFNGGDEPTVFLSPTHVTTIVKPSTANQVGEFPVTVKNAAGESEPLMFEFVEPARAAQRKSQPKKPAKQSKKKKRK